MEHVIDWCFRDIYKGGLWEDDLYVSVLEAMLGQVDFQLCLKHIGICFSCQ